MKKGLLFLDFETYYDDEYSLRKMPTPNYILDPRYETILCAVKDEFGKALAIAATIMPPIKISIVIESIDAKERRSLVVLN